jgi:hypothetical protein
LIYIVTCGPGSLLAEVLLLAESAAEVLPRQRFVWLVSGSWSNMLASALQCVPGAIALPWQPRLPDSASATPRQEAAIPQAILEIASQPDCTWVLYCAPGVLWMSPPAQVLAPLSEGDVLLVPNLLQSQVTAHLPVSELEALKQGIFSQRFLAVRCNSEGRKFLDWWLKRLLEIPLQDQSPASWLHLAPALFPCVRVLRSPWFNVHCGSLHERRLNGRFPRITVNGEPVVFVDLGVREHLSAANHEVDLQTQCAFSSVQSWYEHRLSILSRSSVERSSFHTIRAMMGADDLVLR